jgi:hypothetical protein
MLFSLSQQTILTKYYGLLRYRLRELSTEKTSYLQRLEVVRPDSSKSVQ